MGAFVPNAGALEHRRWWWWTRAWRLSPSARCVLSGAEGEAPVGKNAPNPSLITMPAKSEILTAARHRALARCFSLLCSLSLSLSLLLLQRTANAPELTKKLDPFLYIVEETSGESSASSPPHPLFLPSFFCYTYEAIFKYTLDKEEQLPLARSWIKALGYRLYFQDNPHSGHYILSQLLLLSPEV